MSWRQRMRGIKGWISDLCIDGEGRTKFGFDAVNG